MKATVDRDLCTGCGLCCDACPSVFEFDGDVARVLVDVVPEDEEDLCRQTATECPVEAIGIEESED